ncbi:hypothetical protein [Clostridium beijerinckii]|uniref:hypothetical protein n=2 Tax=Clostridium beijerinckii TaxID=1520 RepID=UPI00156F1B0E|nr:hypothetical protein [Clostridium beijerinckii]NRT78106.1 hypothetical protein [Clostridium beijerinckii]
MKGLIIYDDLNNVFVQMTGTDFKIPEGELHSLVVEVPDGKTLSGLDTSASPPVAIIQDVPKTDIEKLQEQVASLTQANAELTSIVATMETTNA